MKTAIAKIRWLLKGQDSTSATLQTFLSKVLMLATNIGTGVITARFLGTDGRGEQAAITLWPQLLAFMLTLGLPSALIYNLKLYPEEKSKLFSATLVLGTGLGFLAAAIGILFIPQWLGKYSVDVIRDAQLLMLAAPLALLSVTFTAALESQGKFTLANHSRIAAPLITLGLLVGLAFTQRLTPLTAALTYAVPSIPISIWLLRYLWRLFQPQWQGLGTAFKKLLSYGLRSYGIDLLGTLASQVDQALVVGLLAPSAMGMYVVALSLSGTMHVFQASIATVLFPKLAARPLAEVVSLTGQVARVSLLLTFPVGIILMVLGPTVLQVLYGSEFMGAVSVFRILVINMILGGTTMVLAQAFMALDRPGMVTLLQGFGLGLSVPLMLVLIPRYGLIGAGLSLLSSTAARLVFILLNYVFVLKTAPPNLLITRKDFLFLKQKLSGGT
jgi:O-antigen/teichoic acid export membrane protein